MLFAQRYRKESVHPSAIEGSCPLFECIGYYVVPVKSKTTTAAKRRREYSLGWSRNGATLGTESNQVKP